MTLKPDAAPSLSGPSSSSSGTFKLSWTVVAGATRYQLNQSVNGGAWHAVYNGTGRSWTSSGLGNGTYAYKAYGWNAAGWGPASNQVTMTVLHIPAVPARPTIAPSPVTTGGSFMVSWSAVSGATRYDLKHTLVKRDGTTTTGISHMGTATSLYVAQAGPIGSTHEYNVRACNAAGCSAWSATRGVTVFGSGGRQLALPATASSGP